MRIVLQKVKQAKVTVDGNIVGEIAKGYALLLGLHRDDHSEMLQPMINKIQALRIFPDDAGKMNLTLEQVGGAVLVVSQFTLYGSTKKGNRPSFTQVAPPDQALTLYTTFVELFKQSGTQVETGQFGAHMEVDLQNDGPVTLILENDGSNL